MRESPVRICAMCMLVGVFLGAGPAGAQVGNECPDAAPIGLGATLGALTNNTGSTGVDDDCSLGNTIDEWYVFTAPIDGWLRIDTCDAATDFDTVLSVFVACPEVGGVAIECNDDSSSPGCGLGAQGLLKSRLAFAAEAGTSYLIRVSAWANDLDGSGDGTGSFLLSLSLTPWDGDSCQFGAIPVENGTYSGSLANNFGLGGDTDSCGSVNTIDEWYVYQALADATLTVTTCNAGTDFDTVLSAFEACPLDGGVQLVCNDDTPPPAPSDCNIVFMGNVFTRRSTISFPVEEKARYFIRVSAFNDNLTGLGGQGNFVISFSAPTISLGDQCPGALPVGDGSSVGSLIGNSGASGDDSSCGAGDTIDEWLAYTPSASGRAAITTCMPGTNFDTTLAVFDACPVGGGVELACNDDRVGPDPACDLSGFNNKSYVELDVVAGVEVFVRVSVVGDTFIENGSFGHNYEIAIELVCPCDWNDDGSLNDQDFFDWVNDYFTQTGPQGQFDFNEDGFSNDQDWFDFTNCYFSPLPPCAGLP